MRSWHFVGICGIGMSALAQFAAAMQIRVTGSDRALDNPENAALKAMLEAQNIELFKQDGSRFDSGNSPVDAVVYSTAIEESNPDFARSSNIERIHRATALKMLIKERAASGRLLSISLNFGKTRSITYGKLNVMCAISTVPNPRLDFAPIIPPTKTNKSIMETPVTISPTTLT